METKHPFIKQPNGLLEENEIPLTFGEQGDTLSSVFTQDDELHVEEMVSGRRANVCAVCGGHA